jgi:hypothetical protein
MRDVLGFIFIVFFCTLGCNQHSGSSHNSKVGASTIREESSTPSTPHADGETVSPEVWDETFKHSTSLIQIIANPDRYHNKKVCVIGFLRLQFEGNAIYISENDDKYMIWSNALWISLEDNTLQTTSPAIVEKFNERWVCITGIFDKDCHGSWGHYQGAIKNISYLDIQPDRSQIRQIMKEIQQRQNSDSER